MLVVTKVGNYLVHIQNTFTKTPVTIPKNYFTWEVKEGDVIVLAKDEMTSRRKEKEAYRRAKEAGIAHLFKWESYVYKD